MTRNRDDNDKWYRNPALLKLQEEWYGKLGHAMKKVSWKRIAVLFFGFWCLGHVLAGCGANTCYGCTDYGRAVSHAVGTFAAFGENDRPLPVCLCSTDYECQTKCGGSY